MEEQGQASPSVLEVNDVLTAYRLSWVANFMSGPLYAHLERTLHLTRPEFIVLLNCHHRPGTTAQEICLATGRPKNSISRAVIKLAQKAMLTQDKDRRDARLRPLRLTAKGKALYARTIPLFVAREKQMLAVLSADERAAFDGILTKLVNREDDWAQAF